VFALNIKNALVVKSNNLVEAFSGMSTNECKIIALLISKIKKDDNNFNIQSITVNEFNELLDIKGTKTYNYMKVFEKELLKKMVTVSFDNGDRLNVNWFQYSKYISKNATLELCFNSYLKEHLLALKENYTKYLLENICQLNSSYTIQLYEILKQYQKIGYRVINISDLKYMLGIMGGYKLYADFKKRILLPAQSEINTKTDIEFEFIEIKKGKSVVDIKFIIRLKNQKLCVMGDEKGLKDIQDKKANNQHKEEIEKIISDFYSEYNGNLDYILTKNLVELKGLDCVCECIREFKNFVSNAKEIEKMFYDFTKKYGTSSAYKKSNAYHQSTQPIQATNYEQREYSDDDFNSWYDNVTFVKEK